MTGMRCPLPQDRNTALLRGSRLARRTNQYLAIIGRVLRAATPAPLVQLADDSHGPS